MQELVNKIIDTEFKMFTTTQNIGGRAGCQDERQTFEVMRSGQLTDWPKEVLESYYVDLQEADKVGRNLVTEKYARMMQFTYPEEYKQIKDNLPVPSEEMEALTNWITQSYVEWNLEVAEKYPILASKARPIRSENDTRQVTSYETYLRSELRTYSQKTLELLNAYVKDCHEKGQNPMWDSLAKIMKNYGFDTIDAAEEYFANK